MSEQEIHQLAKQVNCLADKMDAVIASILEGNPQVLEAYLEQTKDSQDQTNF